MVSEKQPPKMVIEGTWSYIRAYVIPLGFTICFPFLLMCLIVTTRPDQLPYLSELLFGNTTSWTFVIAIIVWAIVFLKLPGKKFKPPQSSAVVPEYRANGLQYYVTTTAIFICVNYSSRRSSLTIFDNFVAIISTLNIVALVFCVYLLCKARSQKPDQNVAKDRLPEAPAILEFYRGVDLHPTLIGDINVKQLTNCRIGLMLWQILVLAFWFTDLERNGWNYGMAVNAILQSVYLAKFFWWETGYFNTLDMTLDRAGFYLCWGCLVYVPGFYTYSTYFLACNPSLISPRKAELAFNWGIAGIGLNFITDHEKEVFKKSGGHRTFLMTEPKYIEARYTTEDGRSRVSRLLCAGLWSYSRHMNYLFELISCYAWTAPAFGYGVRPFLYCIFLTILLVHRTYRDEEKCAKKYGAAWSEYCKNVKYKILPYVY